MSTETVREQELQERCFELWRAMDLGNPSFTPPDFRAAYDSMFAAFPVDPDARIREVDAGGVRSLQVSVGNEVEGRHIVYIHGGGFLCGNPEGVRSTAALLARYAQATVLLPDYRLAPENPYPAAHDDVYAACRWLLDEQGVSADRLGLVGDSAGGGLAFSTTAALRDAGARPAALVGWSPWLDLEVSGSSATANAGLDPIASGPSLKMCAGIYLQGHDPLDPRVSPLYADLTDFPPVLLEVGTAEVLLDDSRRMADLVEIAGGDVTIEIAQGLPHVFQYFASFLPAGRSSIERSGTFIAKHAS